MSENSFLRPDENENLNAGEMTLLAESIEKMHIESETCTVSANTVENLNITSENFSQLDNPKTPSSGNAESSKDVLRETQNLTGSPLPLKSVENVKNVSLCSSPQADKFEIAKSPKSPFNHSLQTPCASGNLNDSIVLEKNFNNNDDLVVDDTEILILSHLQVHDVSNASFSDALDTSFAAKETSKVDDCPSETEKSVCESFEEVSNDLDTDEKFVDSYTSLCDEKSIAESESCVPLIVDEAIEQAQSSQLDVQCQLEPEPVNEESSELPPSADPSSFSFQEKENPTAESEQKKIFTEEKDKSLNLEREPAPQVSENSVALTELQSSIGPFAAVNPENIESTIAQALHISGTCSVNAILNVSDLSDKSTVVTPDDKINEAETMDSDFCSSTLPENVEDFSFKVPTIPGISSNDEKADDNTSEFPECQVPLNDDFAFKIPNTPVDMENEEFTDAAKFFADPSSFQFLENIHTNAPSDSNIARSSLYMKFDPLVHSSVMQQLEKTQRGGRESMLNAVRNPMRQSVGNFLISFDSPVKSDNADTHKAAGISMNAETSPVLSKSDKPQEEKPLLEAVDEENLLNLSQTDYPVCHSPKSIEVKTNNEKTPIKSYSEDELQEAVKQASIAMQEEFRGKQMEVEQKIATIEKERDSEIEKLKNLYENKACNVSPPRTQSDSCVGTTPAKHDTKSYTEDELNEALERVNMEMQGKLISKEKAVEQVIFKLQVEKEQEINQLKELYEAKLSESASPEKSDCCVGTTPRKPVKSYTEAELQEAVQNASNEVEEKSTQKQKNIERILTQQKEENAFKADKLSNLYTTQNIILEELSTIALHLSHKNKELESHIQDLEAKNEKLKQENQTTQEDFQSVETTFADFHKRYEQCKSMLKTFKENEVHLKRELEKSKKQYETLKDNSEEALNKAESEIAAVRKSNDAQVAVLNAQLKKSELKVLGLENDLVQARREKDELESLCDNLMTKVSQS